MKELMKRLLSVLFVLAFVLAPVHAQQRISIFSDHVEDIARQQGLSFAEAAKRVKELGYSGIDVRVTLGEEKLHTLDSLGFRHACAIADMNFVKGDQAEECRKALDFMHLNHYPRLLLVLGLLPDKTSPELTERVYARTRAFVAQAQREGLDVMVEDYDHPRSPSFDTQALDRLFAAVPDLNHVFDTGNYLFCGEEVTTALAHFRNRIHHVHLKDRKAVRNGESVAIGTGVMPLNEVVTGLLKTGYDGWFTVEHFGAKDMLGSATTSIENIRKAWDEYKEKYPAPMGMRPEMTEMFTPQPVVVTPGDAATQSAPSDAIVLFDGSNLDHWMSANGGKAEWDVHDGIVTVNKRKGDILTRRTFGSFQMHIEWCVPEGITGSGQGRGNSGIFLDDKYEIQILDSYGNETYVNGQSASIYKQQAPLVNAMRQPGEWNTYDIVYTAPVFKKDGTYLYYPRVTVFHNGVLVQNNVEILGTTEYIGLPRKEQHAAGPIRLQSHGDPSAPISFRNIWIREL